jgi:hypothetical protein
MAGRPLRRGVRQHAAFAAPRLGVTFFLTVSIAGQLLMALCSTDRRFGVPRVEISATRSAGRSLGAGAERCWSGAKFKRRSSPPPLVPSEVEGHS